MSKFQVFLISTRLQEESNFKIQRNKTKDWLPIWVGVSGQLPQMQVVSGCQKLMRFNKDWDKRMQIKNLQICNQPQGLWIWLTRWNFRNKMKRNQQFCRIRIKNKGKSSKKEWKKPQKLRIKSSISILKLEPDSSWQFFIKKKRKD